MIKFELNAVPKPDHGRNKPKRGDLTKVTDKVRKEVDRRSMELMDVDTPVCERCGYYKDITKAHMENASQGGSGREPWNIVNICGTHGTKQCHDFIDNTAAGRKWKETKLKSLIKYYKTGEGRKHWTMPSK